MVLRIELSLHSAVWKRNEISHNIVGGPPPTSRVPGQYFGRHVAHDAPCPFLTLRKARITVIPSEWTYSLRQTSFRAFYKFLAQVQSTWLRNK